MYWGFGNTLASRSLKGEGALQSSPVKAESREEEKEKHERHELQSNLAQGCALAITNARAVRYGLTLMAHGVHNPP
jgi:hypothetical protein